MTSTRPLADSGRSSRPTLPIDSDAGEDEKQETFDEMCARLGFTLDTRSGSTVIFAGKRLAAKLQAQAGTVKKPEDEVQERTA